MRIIINVHYPGGVKVSQSHACGAFALVPAPQNSRYDCWGALRAGGVQLFKKGLRKSVAWLTGCGS